MGFEIEFLKVGDGEKSGDAILVRWGNDGAYKIGVIDGGTKESGQNLVNHIREHYGVQNVDFVLNTHPDSDHCSGLTVVLEQLTVKELWMHLPWNYSSDLLQWIDDERVTDTSLQKRLRAKLQTAHEVEKLARGKGVTIREPFQGNTVGPFTVLSPSVDWYKELVVNFRNMPGAKEEENQRFGLLKKALDAAKRIAESFDFETLREGGVTSAENNSSTILYGELESTKILLTGDAGLEALERAADYADRTIYGWNQSLKFVQVPHHGSRRNVSPSILNRILGPKVSEIDPTKGYAYISASCGSTKHPRKSVTNAFRRRGYPCYKTNGNTIRYHSNMPDRGWKPITALEFASEVEDYD